jgi:hypothetical protein
VILSIFKTWWTRL